MCHLGIHLALYFGLGGSGGRSKIGKGGGKICDRKMTIGGVLRKGSIKGKQYIWSFSDQGFVVNFRPRFF